MRFPVAPLSLLAAISLLGGCIASRARVEAVELQNSDMMRMQAAQKHELDEVHAELTMTRERLEVALRANADQGSQVLGEKERINLALGKADENAHSVDELRKELASTRAELDKRLDEVKRAQEARTAAPPPVTIPTDRPGHFAAIETAYAQRDWSLTRTLAREYATRYPADDRVDDVFYLMGDADLKDGRPASAIGEFNRVLKSVPASNVLDKTLLGMGEAYLMMHDCGNARDAWRICVKKFPRTGVGKEAQKRVDSIEKPAPGMCQ